MAAVSSCGTNSSRASCTRVGIVEKEGAEGGRESLFCGSLNICSEKVSGFHFDSFVRLPFPATVRENQRVRESERKSC